MHYVGITSQIPEMRWNNGKAYKHQYVYEGIQEFGWDNVEKEIIASDLDDKTAKQMEKDYIEKYKLDGGVYNKTNGGECGGLLSSEFLYNNKVYTSRDLEELSSDGITYHDLTTRINHHGWDIDKALSKEKTRRNTLYAYNGNEYTISELLTLSNVEGLTIHDLNNRINRRGWDIHRALTQPKDVKLQPHGVGDKKYFYNNIWCNSYDLYLLRKDDSIKQHDIVTRISSGWTIEDAITKPTKKMDKKYLYNGVEYTSKELESLSPCGLLYNTIVSRIKLGWSVEDAVETPSGEKPINNMNS